MLAYKETDEENFHTIYEMKERHSHKLFSKDLAVHLIELPKLTHFLAQHPENKSKLLVLWSRFFNIKSNNEVKELAMENPIFKKAEEALKIIQKDPEAQELARMRDDAKIFYQMDMQAYFEEGELKGRQEGELTGTRQSILKMHSKGMPAAQIAEILDAELSFVQQTIDNPADVKINT